PRDYLFKLGVQVSVGASDHSSQLQRVSIAEAHRFPALRQNYRGVVGRGIDAVGNALRVWREMGVLRFDQDSQLLGTIFFSAMTDAPRIRAIIGDPMSRAEVERHVGTALDLLLDGMTVSPRGRTRA